MRFHAATRVLVGLLAATWLGLIPSGAQAQGGGQACSPKVQSFLQASGFTYTTHNATTWSIDLKRDNVGALKVIISCGTDIVVVFDILAKKAGIQKTAQFYEALARANHDYDFVKVCLDKDGDLGLRIDLIPRLTDVATFKDAVNQVANVSNDWYPKISAFVKR